MDERGACAGNSFSNGNGSSTFHGLEPCMADWYAGVEDDRLLYHWAAL